MNSLKHYMKCILIIGSLFVIQHIQAQQPAPSGRAAILKSREADLVYPLVKGSSSTGILPVTDVSFPFAHKGKSKLVFDLGYQAEKGQVNGGLEEATRIINLHTAAGVKKENLDVYIVFHGPAANSMLDDDLINKLFQVNNPNLALVKQLQDAGVKFVVCGQTIGLRKLPLEAFPDGTLKAFSARTALSDLVQRGYMIYDVSRD
jgi:intracellular sulfur oxidation DsrE/DsrF family protein